MYYGKRRGNPPAIGSTPSIYTPDTVSLFNAIVHQLEERIRTIGARGVIVHAVEEISERSLIQTRQLPVVDLYRAFQADGGGRVAEYYFADGYHWNAKWHRVAANAVERAIAPPPAEN